MGSVLCGMVFYAEQLQASVGWHQISGVAVAERRQPGIKQVSGGAKRAVPSYAGFVW